MAAPLLYILNRARAYSGTLLVKLMISAKDTIRIF